MSAQQELRRVDEHPVPLLRDDRHRREDRRGKRFLDDARPLGVRVPAAIGRLLLDEEHLRPDALEPAEPEALRLAPVEESLDHAGARREARSVEEFLPSARDFEQESALARVPVVGNEPVVPLETGGALRNRGGGLLRSGKEGQREDGEDRRKNPAAESFVHADI